jgi:dipeptidase E
VQLYLSSFRLGNRPEALLDLLAGRTRVAAITNADDYKTGADRIASFERERTDLASLGLEASELDLRDFFGEQARLGQYLAQFDLLWVRGGNSFILRRAMRASGADDAIRELLLTDSIVYAGYSAGPCMLAPSLHGAELVDDPLDIPAGYDREIIWDCLGILPYSLLPHYRSDHPESPLIDKSVEYMIDEHIPFVALRDGEALVRDGAEDLIVG